MTYVHAGAMAQVSPAVIVDGLHTTLASPAPVTTPPGLAHAFTQH